jgi:hypothetical protein
VAELFDAYVASLRAAEKRSAGTAERLLNHAAEAIGSKHLAAEIEPGDVVAHLSGIHDRGSKVQAAMVRAYLSAAFAYGMRAEHDYTRKDAGSRWGIKSNPIGEQSSTMKQSRPPMRAHSWRVSQDRPSERRTPAARKRVF